MLCIFHIVKGVIYWGLLPENTTLNAIMYRTQLEKFESEVVKQGLFGGKIYFTRTTMHFMTTNYSLFEKGKFLVFVPLQPRNSNFVAQ
jgi:hypothetical protein